MNIGIIIVLFNPSQEDLRHAELMADAHKGVIVDNSATRSFPADRVGLMHYLPLMDNFGIAAAQNAAIRFMQQQGGVDYVVFLDQDSRCAPEYADQICAEYQKLSKVNKLLAMLGPTVVEIGTHKAYASAFHKDSYDANGFCTRRELISSGSVVSMQMLDKVGLMSEPLFIDFVDFEWCWRANAEGLMCGMTLNVQLEHQVGNRNCTILRYRIFYSAPQRYFYQFRNHLWLMRSKHVPMQWKLATAVKHIARIFYVPVTAERGGNCFRNMLKGIWQGVFAYHNETKVAKI